MPMDWFDRDGEFDATPAQVQACVHGVVREAAGRDLTPDEQEDIVELFGLLGVTQAA